MRLETCHIHRRYIAQLLLAIWTSVGILQCLHFISRGDKRRSQKDARAEIAILIALSASNRDEARAPSQRAQATLDPALCRH